MPTFTRAVMRRKPLDHLVREADEEDGRGGLRRTMGLGRLTMLGISSAVGTGIFFVLGSTVPKAGPAVVPAFALAAVVAGLGPSATPSWRARSRSRAAPTPTRTPRWARGPRTWSPGA
ncbi:hypothetical protein [Streptomyces erythrochromogenes]|uniref:hypothetical protein n=1 Tax=Streptomyces erythrochromogenes TaxID=285574 RepID=UPI0036862F67